MSVSGKKPDNSACKIELRLHVNLSFNKKILNFMTCASVNVTFIGPINYLSLDIIKFKTACILYYKFGRSDILIRMEFCFSGLFQGLSRLNQDYSGLF